MSNKFTIRSKILEVPPRKLSASGALGFDRGEIFFIYGLAAGTLHILQYIPRFFFCKILFWPRRFEGYLKT